MVETEPELQHLDTTEPPEPVSIYPYLFGSYHRVMDHRSRLALPPLFRLWFGQMVVVREWINHSLTLCRPQDWSDIMVYLAQTEMKNLSLIEVESLFADHTTTSKVDRMGRFLIPAQQQDYADLKPGGTVLILGAGKRVELWNIQRRNEFVAAMRAKSRESSSPLLDWFLRIRGSKGEIRAL